MRSTTLLAALCAAAIATLGVAFRPADESAPTQAQRAERGKITYGVVCSPCHGAEGKGDGPASMYLKVKPRDFTRAQYKFRSTASGQLPLDDDLFQTIAGGLPNTAMPPFADMTPQKIADVIAYIKTFSPRFADPNEYPLDTVKIGAPVAMSTESIRRGRLAYIKAKCWDCHGAQGRGDGPSVNKQFDDKGDRLITNDLTHLWESKVGRTPELVYRVFTTGLNGTTMPSYKDALTDHERWDLSNYVIALGTQRKPYDWLDLDADQTMALPK